MSVMKAEISHEGDAELVEAARSGRREAFDELANRHFGLVYAIGLARLGNRDQAEDLAQEVFLRAFLLLDQLGSQSLFSHWLSRIARNLAIDWQRSGETASRLIPMVSLDDIPGEVTDVKAPDPRREAAGAEQSEALREALTRLSPEEREVVLLHYMEGISQHEIARRMGVNHTTVMRQIARSLGAMRGVMESTVRNMALGFGARPSAKARTAALGAAIIALPAATRSSMAAIAAQSLHSGASVSSAKVAGAGIGSLPGFINTSLSLLKTGGAVMGYGKSAAGIICVVALAGGGYYYYNDESAPLPPRPGVTAVPIQSSDPAIFNLGLPAGKRIVMRTESIIDSRYELPKEMLAQMNASKYKAAMSFLSGSKLHTIEDMAMTAREVQPDGGRSVEFETVGVSMEMNMGEQIMSGAEGTVRAGKGDSAPGVKKLDLSNSISRKVVGHLNAKGEMISMEGFAQTPVLTTNQLPASNPFSNLMNAANTEEAWKKKYQCLFAPKEYSATPVKIGETWKTRNIQRGETMGEPTEATCHFTGWKMLDGRRVAEIAFDVDSNSSEKPVPKSLLPSNSKYESITQSGTLLFDSEFGITTQMAVKSKVVMSMDLPVPGKSGLKMKIQTDSTTNLSLVE